MQVYEVLVSLSYVVLIVYSFILSLEMRKIDKISRKRIVVEFAISSFLGLIILIIGFVFSNGSYSISEIIILLVFYLICLILVMGYICFCFYKKKIIALLNSSKEEELNEYEQSQVNKFLKIYLIITTVVMIILIIGIVAIILNNVYK